MVIRVFYWNMMLINNTYFNNKIELINIRNIFYVSQTLQFNITLNVTTMSLQDWIYISQYYNVANQHFWDIDSMLVCCMGEMHKISNQNNIISFTMQEL